MAILDDLSGFEFEDLMEDVFRNLGYENVRQSTRTGDEGRDIIMEEVVDGRRRTVVVECKHTGTVSRPVVQKLHSAVTTYDVDGPKRGMIVTTGRFTDPAEEYARQLGSGDGSIELVDGRKLRELGERVGLDVRNGRIEVICEETLRPLDPTGGVGLPMWEALRDVGNIDPEDVSKPHASVIFRPVLNIEATVEAVFETSVGVVHEIHDRDRLTIDADREGPRPLTSDIERLVTDNRHATVALDDVDTEAHFDAIDTRRFGWTETEYKEWAVDRLRERHTTTVQYTGDNNVTYTKECEPNLSDVSVQRIDPVYVPTIQLQTDLGEYSYPLSYAAAGPSRVTLEDGVRECVHCGDTGGTHTYCENCGSINCSDHIYTERLEDEPVCTGCAVTDRFALKTKYFYDDQNLERFRAEYEEMAVHEKAIENPPLVAGSVLLTLVAVVGVLVSVGAV